MFQMKISPVCPAAAKIDGSAGWKAEAERHDGAERWMCGVAGSKFRRRRFLEKWYIVAIKLFVFKSLAIELTVLKSHNLSILIVTMELSVCNNCHNWVVCLYKCRN